jgi:methionyl aminopeptidase
MSQYVKDFLQAGKIASCVRAFGKGLIVSGASYNSVIAKINQKIVELGARAAFPPQIALDNVAAHFLPYPTEDIIFSDQVVKLDVGVCYNGAIGDCAVTVDLSGKHQTLVEAAEAALLAAETSLKVGLEIRSIGKVIEETITRYGYRPIKNLSGHGLGMYLIHTAPQIPNYDSRQKDVIRPAMTFAIEPFATNGRGFIHEEGHAAIFSQIKKGSIPQSYPKALMDAIISFEGLPFAIHDLIKTEINLAQLKVFLKALAKSGFLAAYPPLVEKQMSVVAQAENSVLIDEDGQVHITTRQQ